MNINEFILKFVMYLLLIKLRNTNEFKMFFKNISKNI